MLPNSFFSSRHKNEIGEDYADKRSKLDQCVWSLMASDTFPQGSALCEQEITALHEHTSDSSSKNNNKIYKAVNPTSKCDATNYHAFRSKDRPMRTL